ncbi:hypothetical protein DPMN_001785, partial [Dreissena polymorpha]
MDPTVANPTVARLKFQLKRERMKFIPKSCFYIQCFFADKKPPQIFGSIPKEESTTEGPLFSSNTLELQSSPIFPEQASKRHK